MTPAPKKNRGAIPEPHPPEVRALCFQTWLEAGKPSYEKLAELLRERHKLPINKATLARWAKADPAWQLEQVTKEKAPASQILSALDQLKKKANALEADHFIGLKAELVGRLFSALKDLPVNSVEEWRDALGCCEQIEALIHNERGKAIRDAVTNGATPIPTSIMDKLNPAVSMAPFTKKPNGGA